MPASATRPRLRREPAQERFPASSSIFPVVRLFILAASAKKSRTGAYALRLLFCSRTDLLYALVVGVLERLADRGRHGEIHIDPLGRNRVHEPLGVDFFDLARFHDPAYGLVDERLELRVVLAQHHAIGLLAQRFGQDLVAVSYTH